MRIVLDADVLGRQRTGDETYVAALLRELPRLADRDEVFAITRRPDLVPAGVEPVEVPIGNQALRMTVGVTRALRRLRPDVAHFLYAVPPGYGGRTVVTIHDLSFEHFSDVMGLKDRLLFRTQVPRAARKADRVLTGSEWTRNDIVQRYGIAREKVVVTPYGVDARYRPGADSRDGEYALFVGAIQPRKDPLTALEALALVDGDLRLVLVGPEKRGAERVRQAIARLGLDRRVELKGHVDQDELAALYRGARMLVFPSRYEGFGLPVLEAMASGTPVVASTAGAIPEVAGDAAILVEPGNAAALAGAMERALADRERLVARGIERARRFSWGETARQTLAVYRELA